MGSRPVSIAIPWTVNGREPLPGQVEEFLQALWIVAEGVGDVDIVSAERFPAKGVFSACHGLGHGHLGPGIGQARGHIDDRFFRILDHGLHLVPLGRLRRQIAGDKA